MLHIKTKTEGCKWRDNALRSSVCLCLLDNSVLSLCWLSHIDGVCLPFHNSSDAVSIGKSEFDIRYLPSSQDERHFAGVNLLYLNSRYSRTEHSDFTCGSIGEVYYSATYERTAVVNPYDGCLAVFDVGDLQHCAEWVSLVCACQAVVMQPFSACCACSCCTFSIIRGFASLLCMQRGKTQKERYENDN